VDISFSKKLRKRRLVNRGARIISRFMSLSVFAIFGLIFLMLFWEAFPLFFKKSVSDILLTSQWMPHRSEYGLLRFIVGSLYTTLLALVIAVPLSVLTAIFMSEYLPKKIAFYAKMVFDVLSGVSPVVYGFWGVIIIVPFVRVYLQPFFAKHFPYAIFASSNMSGYSVLSGAMVLALMASPLIVSIADEVLKAVPFEMRQASMALGATKWEAIKKVLLKKAAPGIIAAIILSLSRTIGETMAVLMVAGCHIQETPFSIFDPAYPLPALIANTFGETMSIPLYKSAIFLAAFVLLLLTAVSNLLGWSILIKIEEERA
jgi:phosphate transport system permease protein